MTSNLIFLKVLTNICFQRPLKKCSVRIERLPAHVLGKSFCKINPENKFVAQKNQNEDIKSEIKVENHDNLDDLIYKESVSICVTFLDFLF